MSPTTSAAALVVRAPANLSGEPLASPVVAGSSFRGAGLRHGASRVLRVFAGLGEMLVAAYAFPLAILAVGIPIAVFIRLVLEAGRALWHL